MGNSLNYIEENKTIKDHSSCVFSLLLLKDGRIASCSNDNTIRIYDPKSKYHCDLAFKGNSGPVYSMCQLDNGDLVTGFYNGTIKIWTINEETCEWKFTINNAHASLVSKVVALSNNRFASCGGDCNIKIWNGSEPSQVPIKVLEGHHSNLRSILRMNDKDILISISEGRGLRVWNLRTYECISSELNNIKCYDANSLYQIDDDRVIVGSDNGASIINITNTEVEYQIKNGEGKDFYNVSSFVKLNNDHIFCGCGNGKYCLIDTKKMQYTIQESTHKEGFTDLLKVDNYTFLSSSYDNTIKIWKY